MRVTTELQSQQAILNLQSTYGRLAKLQNQISTGNQVSSPSDNPVGAVQILQNNAVGAQLTTNLTNIQAATNVLQTSVNSITQAQNILTSVTNTALSANNPSNQAGTNSELATQVNAAINQLLGVANTQLPDGTYIFGGTASNKQPFSVTSTDPNGQPTSIAYQGNDQSSKVIVGVATTVNTLIPGDSIFQSNDAGTTVYGGVTGAKAGSGADSATGTGTLLVQHTSTSYASGSGVAPGLSSATDDTALGPAGKNKLVINDTSGDGSGGTVSLNGGPPVVYSNSDTNLLVTGPSGETVYLDTTAITPGFSGSVNLTSDGTLSVDGGVTTTPIDYSGNQTVTDGVTGATTNVDSSNIRSTGSDSLKYSDKADLFQTLIALRDTINNTQGLTSSERSAALSQQIGVLQKFSTVLTTPLGNQSTQAQFLSNLQTRTTALQTNLKEATSNIQSTDMATAIVQLQQTQTLYQAGLQLTASMNNLSLANFIK